MMSLDYGVVVIASIALVPAFDTGLSARSAEEEGHAPQLGIERERNQGPFFCVRYPVRMSFFEPLGELRRLSDSSEYFHHLKGTVDVATQKEDADLARHF